MKYKILKSIAHNFTHSFVHSSIIEDLKQLAREADGERISFHWIPDSNHQIKLPEHMLNSISYFKAWLPKHIDSSGAKIDSIREFRTDIFLKPSKQITVEAHLLDDRGKEHISSVYF